MINSATSSRFDRVRMHRASAIRMPPDATSNRLQEIEFSFNNKICGDSPIIAISEYFRTFPIDCPRHFVSSSASIQRLSTVNYNFLSKIGGCITTKKLSSVSALDNTREMLCTFVAEISANVRAVCDQSQSRITPPKQSQRRRRRRKSWLLHHEVFGMYLRQTVEMGK